MKKKSLLLRLVVLVTAMMCALGASAYDFTYGGYYYNVLTDSTVAITYRDGNFNSYSGDVTIPEHVYNGSKYYTVTQVGVFAFLNSTRVTSVTIPNTVTYIESRAFENCVELESVVMGKNCSFYNPEEYCYSTQVFKNCPNLLSVTCWRFQPDEWPESGNLNFDQLVLDYAVLRVPRGAIPNYQATEGWRLFNNYQEISAYFNYNFYKEGVFYKIKNGSAWVTYMDEDYNSYSGTVTIPSSVTYDYTTYTVKGIDDYAFRSCGDLTKVEMPPTIDSIGKYAFYYCTKLTEIDIPNGVTYIGNGAFSWCSKLKSLMFPAGVTVINGSTCTGCSALETVWLPVNLTDIYAGAFSNCNAITKIISLSEAPPWMYNKNVFPSAVYDNATLYIPEDAIGNGYTSPYGNWQYFTTQKPYNQYLSSEINAPGGNITFSTLSTNNYPWLVKTNGYRFCAQSGNTGIHESTSVLTATVTVPNGGTLSFLYKAWGEGTSNAWDACSFFVDGEEKLKLGAYDNVDWETFTVEIPAGTHTLKWRYSKDGSINKEGDYFAIDNVLLTPHDPEAYACYTESNTTLTFYYDTQRSSRPGVTYDLNTGNNDTGWETDGTNANVTKVVFDPSFADARPTTTYSWFYDMSNLQSFTGMSYLNTSEVTNMAWMFANCTALTSLDLSHFNTSKVTSMWAMFYRCTNLRTIYGGSGWSTSAVTSSNSMFQTCRNLVGGQGTTYDSSNPTDKTYAHIDGGPSNPGYFTAEGEEPWNGSEAYACYTPSNTTLTFYYDNQRSSRPGTTYDLNTGANDAGWETDGSNANVTKVVFDPSFAGARPTTTYDWFYDMTNLQSITGLSYLNTSEVTNMAWMFGYCAGLTSLDLSHFNTSKVTNMGEMFYGCSSLTSLDLSSFNTSKVTSMSYMFYNSSNLRTVYVGNGWSTAAVTNSEFMFSNCTSLVGGQGTAYNSSNPKDKTYAHIDGGPSNPGYFTEKPAFLRGDVDGNGRVNMDDLTALINYLLTSNSTGINMANAASCDSPSSTTVSMDDLTALINYLLTNMWP